MNIGPLEAQLIASSVLAIPGIVLVLVAVLSGQFSRKNEVARYAVFVEEQQEEYWERPESPKQDGAADGAGRRDTGGEP